MRLLLGLVLPLALVAPTGPATSSANDPEGPRDVRMRAVAHTVLHEASPRVGTSAAGGVETMRATGAGFGMVGFTWSGPAPSLTFRTRGADGWTRWLRAEPLPGAHGSEPVWVGTSRWIQVRVDRDARDLHTVLIDPGSSPRDARPVGAVTTRRTTSARSTTGSGPIAFGPAAPIPNILTRQDWGADESWRTSPPRWLSTIEQVHIHHTATANSYSRADVPGIIRAIYRYHTKSLGWSDIGYNFLVDRFGRAWVGRAGGPWGAVRGAHTLGFNNVSTGIAVIGNFQSTTPPDAVLTTLRDLAAWKLALYARHADRTVVVTSEGSDRFPAGDRVRLPVIDGHRDTNDTECPGNRLYNLLPKLRRMTERRIERFAP